MYLPKFHFDWSDSKFQELFAAKTERYQNEFLVHRVYAKDSHMWSGNREDEFMGWLDLPDPTTPAGKAIRNAEGINELVAQITDEGFKHVVLVGMGGSVGAALAWLTLRNALGAPAPRSFDFHVLDTIVPSEVVKLLDCVDVTKTLFVIASKSGKTVETRAHFDLLWEEVGHAYLVKQSNSQPVMPAEAGIQGSTGSHFVALTDKGTQLETLAKERNLRQVFYGDSEVGGRYSALSVFGLLPACLMGFDTAALLEHAEEMHDASAPQMWVRDNPSVSLGLILATLAELGRNKLTIVASPELDGFLLWLEQLFGESTGKMGYGLIPIIQEPQVDAWCYAMDRVFLHLKVPGRDAAVTESWLNGLSREGHPVLTIEVGTAETMAAEFFRFELATAIFCGEFKINPFDQPEVDRMKLEMGALLHLGASGQGDALDVSAMESIAQRMAPGDTLAINAYVGPKDAVIAKLTELREEIARRGFATTLSFGPQYLHSVGQLQKGGPAGMHIVMVTSGTKQASAPAASGTGSQIERLGIIMLGQVRADVNALKQLGRDVIWVEKTISQ
jgi:glucose-6-phosphate isomerase